MNKSFSLKKIRLINFHNFTDETISVNGHLFLLGGNGSGKTTVLDAVHFVMTAGRYSMELNSAARMADQPKSLGRKLQGIFLRYDLEKGQRNTDKTIGYAVLEFEKPSNGEKFCIGCGALATNMETAPYIWGFEASMPLEKLSLLRETSEGLFPLGQEELKSTGVKVYNRDRYIDVIAHKFFESKTSYKETMHLIAAGKSYRELVSKIKDQAQLFRDLLPPPDEAVYLSIQQSLHDIEKIQQNLEDQQSRINTLRELEKTRHSSEKTHQKCLRYAYIDADYNMQLTLENIQSYQNKQTQINDSLQKAKSNLAELINENERIESRLEVEKNSDAYKNNIVLQQLKKEVELLLEKVEYFKKIIRDKLSETKDLEADIENHRSEFHDYFNSFKDCCFSLASLTKLELMPPPDDSIDQLSENHQRILDNVLTVEKELSSDVESLKIKIKQTTSQQLKLENELSKLKMQKEAAPPAKHYEDLERKLVEEKVEFWPLYRAIEPGNDLDDNLGRVIEEIIGPERLCSIMVSENAIKKVRATILAEPYNIPVIDSKSDAVPPVRTDGLRRFLDFHGPYKAVAEIYVAELLDKYCLMHSEKFLDSNVEKYAVTETGIVLEGSALKRVDAGRNQYLGTKARQQTRQQQIDIIVAQINELQNDIDANKQKLSLLEKKHNDICAQINILRNLQPKTAINAQNQIILLQTKTDKLMQENESFKNQLQEAISNLEGSKEKVRASESAISEQELEDTDKKIKELQAQKKQNDSDRSQVSADIGKYSNELQHIEENLRLYNEKKQTAVSKLNDATNALLANVKEISADDIQNFVYVTNRGNQVKKANSSKLLKDAEIERATKIEAVHNFILRDPLIQRDYRLIFNDNVFEILSNDGRSLSQLCTEIENRHIEDKKILEGKNRQLFEDLIINQVVTSLCSEETNLKRTIKQMNSHLSDLTFGNTKYKFSMHLRSDFKEFRELVRKVSETDEQSRNRLRDYFDGNKQLLLREGEKLPEFLDYRQWYDVILEARTNTSEGVSLNKKRLSLGSGGEQSVPNYILLLSLAKVHLDHTGSRIRIILLDEAFYGIDSQRRNELLGFADRIGLNLVIAHPELDGVTDALTSSTTLLVEKTPEGDVYLGSYDLTIKKPAGLFDEEPEEKEELINLGTQVNE